MPFAAGQRLGHYQIEYALEGGGGECYRARQTDGGGDALVRVLARSWSFEPAQAWAFEKQVETMRQLAHPNVARLYDICLQDGVLFAASEWLEGETLRQKLSKGRLLPHKAAGYAVQTARGLAAGHLAGLLHADLKPENIMIDRDSRLRIRDFGLANLGYSDAEYPETNTGAGMVVDYAAPEQVLGEAETAQSDIFSLGVILYEMLSGVRPFLRPALLATTGAILQEEPAELPHAIAPALVRIVRNCLAKKPKERFFSVADVALAIENFGSLTVPVERTRKTHRAHYTGVVLGAVAGLLIGAVLGGAVVRRLLRPVAATPLVFRQLTASGHDFSPSASGDGKKIVFSSDRDGASCIWLLRTDGGSEVPLTRGSDVLPRISADGESVLFIRQEEGGDNLYVVSAAGGTAQLVRKDVDGADWAGRRGILWARHARIGLVDREGKETRELAYSGTVDLRYPRLSPDGKYAAAVAGMSIAVFQLETPGRQYTLSPLAAAGSLSGFTWSPDSQSIVYFQAENQVSGGQGPAHIVRQNVKTGRATLIGFSLENAGLLDVPGTGRLLLDGGSGRQNLTEMALRGNAVATPLTLGSVTDEGPTYAADGSSIFFASLRSGRLGIWRILRGNGASRREVPAAGADDTEPWLSRDGGRIFWSSNREGHFEVYAASLNEPRPRAVTHDGVAARHASVTADGMWVVYESENPARRGIWKTRPSGEDDTQVIAGPAMWPEVSGDGKYVLYSVAMGAAGRAVRVSSMRDGKAAMADIAVAAGSNAGGMLGRARWMDEGRAIAFIGLDERGRAGVFAQNFAEGRDTADSRRKVGGFDDRQSIESFAVSPDGAWLTVAARERMSNIVEVSNVPGIGPREH